MDNSYRTWSSDLNKCLNCPSGFTVSNGHCYYVSTGFSTWSAANSYCTSVGGYLMVLNTNSERDLLVSYYNSVGGVDLYVNSFELFIKKKFIFKTHFF